MTTTRTTTPTTTPTIDSVRTDALADRLVGVANDAALALMLSVGHRTELFDVMAKIGQPATPRFIADVAGLSERYVREWLGAMTVGRIVEHDPDAGTYLLPPEHAALLTRAASPTNVGVTMQWIAVMGSVEQQVVEAFRHGKGIPYSAYDNFQGVLAEESDQTTLAALLDQIIPLAPGLPDRLEQGIDVLEFGCGRGHALLRLARTYPNSRFTGLELSPEVVGETVEQAKRDGLSNLSFTFRDAATLDAQGAYDLVLVFDAVHDQRDPAAVLANVHRALRPGGVFLMQDIKAHTCHGDNLDHPLGAFTYAISTFHCMSVSLAQGGAGLGAAWGKEKALEMLAAAGFTDARVEELEHDIINYYYVMAKR